jgi:uncharacterized membrane protein
MNVWIKVIGIGFVAGLRSMTAPAVVARAAHERKLKLRSTPLRFMRSNRAVQVLETLAAMEYVADLLPFTPPRTEVPSLATRAASGAFSASCVALAEKESPWIAAPLGAAAAIAGSFAGYQFRKNVADWLSSPDYPLAISEDALAVGLGSAFLSGR